jgi:hypothetical protein
LFRRLLRARRERPRSRRAAEESEETPALHTDSLAGEAHNFDL